VIRRAAYVSDREGIIRYSYVCPDPRDLPDFVEIKDCLRSIPKLQLTQRFWRASKVARAHCWFDDLVSGRRGSMVEIAKCNGVGKQYVSRLMRLAFLAPETVERIVAGCQPPELTAQSLQAGRLDIPVDWAAQKRALGFAPPL
jgi:hypothetical protein